MREKTIIIFWVMKNIFNIDFTIMFMLFLFFIIVIVSLICKIRSINLSLICVIKEAIYNVKEVKDALRNKAREILEEIKPVAF